MKTRQRMHYGGGEGSCCHRHPSAFTSHTLSRDFSDMTSQDCAENTDSVALHKYIKDAQSMFTAHCVFNI